MAGERAPSDGWTLFIGAIAVLAGLYLLASGWSGLPLSRETLAIADHVGPLDVDMPLVSEGLGRNRGNYRTQLIPLAAAGQPVKTYSPARTLWVSDTGTVRFGQTLRFLVDPQAGLIYEATSQGRTLLHYDETAANLRSSARMRMLFGAALLVFAAYQAATILLRRRRNAS